MPQEYISEMVADWTGASMAQGYGSDVRPWYDQHKDDMILHPDTRKQVEKILSALYPRQRNTEDEL
jgi:coproporphyrinogen III oxidase